MQLSQSQSQSQSLLHITNLNLNPIQRLPHRACRLNWNKLKSPEAAKPENKKEDKEENEGLEEDEGDKEDLGDNRVKYILIDD